MRYIKNGIDSTDEFRMYSFKVQPCFRAYSHDWRECPFVHKGENARRRDPRKHPYSRVQCPNFQQARTCGRGDSCEYAHGVFESGLHPTHYRTRLCDYGTSCDRRVCFFAHSQDELRVLHVNQPNIQPSDQDLNVQLLNSQNSSGFNQFQQQQIMVPPINTNFTSYEVGSTSAAVVGLGLDSWSKCGSSNVVNGDEFENVGDHWEEPDISWVQSLVKETPEEMEEKRAAAYGGSGGVMSGGGGGGGGNSNTNTQIENTD